MLPLDDLTLSTVGPFDDAFIHSFSDGLKGRCDRLRGMNDANKDLPVVVCTEHTVVARFMGDTRHCHDVEKLKFTV